MHQCISFGARVSRTPYPILDPVRLAFYLEPNNFAEKRAWSQQQGKSMWLYNVFENWICDRNCSVSPAAFCGNRSNRVETGGMVFGMRAKCGPRGKQPT
eukprot:s4433_g6.t1